MPRQLHPRSILCLLGQVILIAFFAFSCGAKDKNGVSPDTISLPGGPGSIEGLGDAFQPMLNTGSSRYSVNIAVPAGTAGNTPRFSLRYDSGLGDGPVGIGWSVEPSSISRQVDKGIPRYVDSDNGVDDNHDGRIDEPDERDTFLGSDGEELVEVAENVYRARIEGSFVRYRRVDDYWQIDLKDGTTLEYGAPSDARVDDPVNSSHIYRWFLNKSTDVNGNTIEYSYASIAGSDNRKYISEIRYGPGSSPWPVFHFVKFSYEARPDWRKDYRSGFLVRTAHRLRQIDIGIQGSTPAQCLQGDWNQDTVTDSLISRYLLSYTSAFPNVSHLSRVTRYGSDGVNSLPPIRFGYVTASPAQILSASESIIRTDNAPSVVMDNELVELIDLNRDGLADILHTDYTGSVHFYSLNAGSAEENSRIIQWNDEQIMDSADGLALHLHLAEDRVNLADMNGDGLADLVYTTEADDVFYYANEGNLSWSSRQRMSTRETAPPAPSGSDDVIIADMDFDKRIDVIRSTENGYTFWFNRAEGRYSSRVISDGARFMGKVILFSAPGVQTADMNGDRLADVAQVKQNSIIYSANMGHGNFAQTVSIAIPDVLLTAGERSQISRAKLTDINGDGLADLVVERAVVNELWFWLNLGNDALSGRYKVTGIPAVDGSFAAVRWADMNGNGTMDLVYADSTAADRLLILDIGKLVNGSAHPNLLNRIENGLGLTTDIFYRSSTEFYLHDLRADTPWTTTIPFPVQVVSEVQTRTGLDLDGVPGLDVYRKSFHYRNGFYEDREKQFRGFAEVQVTEHGDATAPTRVNVHKFFTGGPDGIDNDGDEIVDELSPQFHREEDALKGMVRELSLMDEDGTLFKRQENSWAVRNLLVNQDGIEVRFAYKEQSDTFIYEGQITPQVLRSTFIYDDYGNVTEERNYGALSISGDELFSVNEYINDSTNWLLGFPQRQYFTDSSENIVAESLSYYDGGSFVGLPTGQLTRGLLSRQQGWVGGNEYINLLRSSYDDFGNIIAVLDAAGNRRSLEYDSELSVFPVQETIEVGGGSPDLQVQAAYNIGLGVMTSSLDFNGHETRYNYDSFGRATSFVQPGDSQQHPTRSFSYTMTDPQENLLYSYDSLGELTLTNSLDLASSVTSHSREISGETGTFDTIQYLDGMGRNLAQLTEGESGFIVNKAVLFNAMGLPRYDFSPYATGDPSYSPPTGNVSEETRYDAAGRGIIFITAPDDDGVQSISTVAHLPLHEIMTDANGNIKDLYRDGQERLIQVEEHNGGETYLTGYSYDNRGNLIQITDAGNNIKTFSYDRLQRRTAMDDPDRGHVQYQYDLAGNILSITDNKGQQTQFSYDGANRVLTTDFLDNAGITPDISYHYDASSSDYPDAANLKGKLSWISDLSGGSFLSYDDRGNPDRHVDRIADNGFVVDYLTVNQYDAMGRVSVIIFPDGDHISYTYNNRSLLKSIPGFVDEIEYFASGKRSALHLANGNSTSYTHDPRQRLSRLTTLAADGFVLQDISYRFDGVSNVLGITDNRGLPADTPANGSQSFSYDGVHRLLSAQGQGFGAINYQYDNIGNMIFKSSPANTDPAHINDPLVNLGIISNGGDEGTSNRGSRFPGDAPGPHAVTATASGLSYGYDDNGSMISHGNGDAYEWNFSNRLGQVTTADSVSKFIYDAGGQRRISKNTENGITKTNYYVNAGYEIRNGTPVKYIFDDSRRIARVEGRLAVNGEPSEQIVHLHPGWNFFSLDVEPTLPVIVDVLSDINGKYTEVWTFDASLQQYAGYVPSSGINDLIELHAQTGYLVKMAEPASLFISGLRSTGDISLLPGWNLISSPVDTSLPVSEVLTGITGNCEGIWAYETPAGTWHDYLPDQLNFLNNLVTLEPGRAYWLKMTDVGHLPYQQQLRKTHFYHADHLGSSNLVTNATGTVVEETQFYPFGRPRYEEQNGIDSAYKFTGKEFDRATGLMYYEARYYDPVVSRFVSVDPYILFNQITNVLEMPSLHIYSYASNNPLNRIDPTGMEDYEVDWDGVAIGAFQVATGAAAVTVSTAVVASSPVTFGVGLVGVVGITGGTVHAGLGVAQIMASITPLSKKSHKRMNKKFVEAHELTDKSITVSAHVPDVAYEVAKFSDMEEAEAQQIKAYADLGVEVYGVVKGFKKTQTVSNGYGWILDSKVVDNAKVLSDVNTNLKLLDKTIKAGEARNAAIADAAILGGSSEMPAECGVTLSCE